VEVVASLSQGRTAAAQCGLFTHRSVPVIFEPPCIILPLVLYGCETWSLTLREECGLRVFENRVLKRIFGLKKDKITGEQNKLHNEELNDLHSSPTNIWVIKMRRMRWAGHVTCMGKRFIQGVDGETGGKENTCKTQM